MRRRGGVSSLRGVQPPAEPRSLARACNPGFTVATVALATLLAATVSRLMPMDTVLHGSSNSCTGKC